MLTNPLFIREFSLFWECRFVTNAKIYIHIDLTMSPWEQNIEIHSMKTEHYHFCTLWYDEVIHKYNNFGAT